MAGISAAGKTLHIISLFLIFLRAPLTFYRLLPSPPFPNSSPPFRGHSEIQRSFKIPLFSLLTSSSFFNATH